MIKFKILFIILLITVKQSYGQSFSVDQDSVLITCTYQDFLAAVKKENTKENYEYGKNFLDSLTKGMDNIIIKGEDFEGFFGPELSRLVKKNKVTFFDKRTNKKVNKIKRIKNVRSGYVIYDLFIDEETKNHLYGLPKRTPNF